MKNLKNSLWLSVSLLLGSSSFLRAQTNADDAAFFAGRPANVSQTPTPAAVSNANAAPNVQISGESHAPVKEILSSVLAILSSFGMPVFIVGLVLYFKFRRDRLAHETVRTMIEKGVPITPEVLAQLKNRDPGDSNPKSPTRYLLTGLICLGVGAALLVSSLSGAAIPGFPIAGAWIVMFVGIAFLIVWFVEKKNNNDALPPRQ